MNLLPFVEKVVIACQLILIQGILLRAYTAVVPAARQSTIMLVIDDSLVGFRIEMLFQYDKQDGTSYVNWCHGVL